MPDAGGVTLTNQLPQLASTAAVQFLTANASSVTGSVPVGASGAQSLVQLALGGNNLRGSISQGLGQATNLKQLNLSNNLLAGEPFCVNVAESTMLSPSLHQCLDNMSHGMMLCLD